MQSIRQFIYDHFPFLTIEFYVRLWGYWDKTSVFWKINELLVIIISGLLIFYTLRKNTTSMKKAIFLWFLVGYISLVLISTVFARSLMETRNILLIPFSAYYEWIINRNYDLFWECFYNIILFIPVGIASGILWPPKKCILLGCGFSICIELLQYLLSRGTFEVDDIINNTIGVLVGLLFIKYLRKIISLIRLRNG